MEFSPQKLIALREAKNWIPSDLARMMYGSMISSEGKLVARNRDRISAWESGRNKPSPHSLKRLADALGVQPADLCDAPAPRRAPEKARLWETVIQELADSLPKDDPRTPHWRSVITSFIGWEHPVREMLDVLVR